MTADIAKRYEALRRKHRLPAFDDVDREFNLSSIEKDKFLLRDIRNKIWERIQQLCEIVGEVLQPDVSIAGLYESSILDETGKKQVFDAYKKLMRLNRRALELSLKNDEREDAQFVREMAGFWKKFKNELAPIARKLKDSWAKETEEKDEIGYLG